MTRVQGCNQLRDDLLKAGVAMSYGRTGRRTRNEAIYTTKEDGLDATSLIKCSKPSIEGCWREN